MAFASLRKSLLSLVRKPESLCNKVCSHGAKYSTAVRGLDAGSSAANKSVYALKWELCAAVCLTRLPIVSPKLTDLEQRYIEMLEEQELERSVLSEWEVEKIRQAELIKAIEAGEKGTEDMDFQVMHQDREDEWEKKSKDYEFPEKNTEHDSDMTNPQRVMQQPLTYVVNKMLGNDSIWMLPTAAIRDGETMRECAERALSLHCHGEFQATILSNAPSAYYKYKFPKEVRLKSNNDNIGAKIFIYSALVKNKDGPDASSVTTKDVTPNEDADCENGVLGYAWASRDELPVYLKPKYFAAVEKILL